ncbi:Protein of unknown function DUF262 [Saccharopolyspora shandongensis]|uniref:GmrSD restriction endonucleases N-terminal domain-containing protein n=1 Tax=Saccharopolyspora shandongensis TaxID=418495 RepID=A0A1H3M611_9PSEU|nr:DUF262 domain-containing protein [Saccharopolyspora shandongensis]SDY72152.1 Protein of unknown function DUF262 [Saccharopolyspora shandongensis]
MQEAETDLVKVNIEELDAEDASGSVDEYSIVSSPNDFNTRTMTSFIEEGAVRIPRFQRNYVWDRRRASKLIESLILGLPIPQVFLYEQDSNEFLIIDGQQRLLTVFFFMKERFPRKDKRSILRELFSERGGFSDDLLADDDFFEPFKLFLAKPGQQNEKTSKFHGLTYATLGDHKRQFDLRTIRNVIVKQVSPEDGHSSMFEMFNRLNTGGVNLNPQEIRASLYHSRFFEELYTLNEEPQWRTLLGAQTPDSRMKDIEMVLRSLALREGVEGYAGSMNSFVNRFCERAKNFGQETIERIRSEWRWFARLNESCDEATYRTGATKSARFSPLLFEAVYVAVMQLKEEGRVVSEIRPEWVEHITRSGEFTGSMHEGSTKTSNMLKRLSEARRILSSLVDG